MNVVLANSFTQFFTNLFSNWQLVLFGVLTILLVLCIFFLKFKTAFFVLLAIAIALGVTLTIDLIVEAVKWNMLAFIDFLIRWLPTILFSLIVVLATLVNAKRGRRKSLILFAHSAGAAVGWIIFYYFAVKSTKIDASFVRLVNLFMGENGLQNALNVSTEATTLRSIFTLYIENAVGGGFTGVLIHDTAAYVYTLADMVYHIGFAAFCFGLYLDTIFILYIIYLCCYSERKYKKKKTAALSENKTDTKYKKHHVYGGLVGLARGIVIGILSLSFLGAGLFIVAGRGDGKIKDYEVGGKYEKPLSIYQSIESYGTQGIFLILNAMSDPNDMPYYLFAADLVFSGALNDEFNGVSENINLRKELGSFTGLARDTVTLLLKYGSEDISASLNGTSETGLMGSVLGVMKNQEFQQEFDSLIAEYDTPTYVYNFSMSLVSSVLAHIDEASFAGSLSERTRELLKVTFKEGYLSPYIPEDCTLHDINVQLGAADPWQTTGRNVRPYLGAQQLFTKEDVRHFLNIFLTILTERGEETNTFDLVRSVLPSFKKLSLFQESNGEQLDPVFARMYCFFQNSFLKAEGAEGYSYNALVNENVTWTKELSDLFDVAEDFFAIYDDVHEAESAVFNMLLYVFDRENPNREKDTALFDGIVDRVTSSRLLGKTLASSFFTQTLSDGLGQLFDGLYISDSIVYENTFAEDGKVSKYGELYYFLKGLRHIGNMENQALLELLFGEGEDDASGILSTLADAVTEKDEDKRDLTFYASRSELLRSLVSVFLIQEGEGTIYVPQIVLEKNGKGEYVNVIVSEEFENLLSRIGLISSFIEKCVDGDYYASIDEFFDSGDFMELIETSRIAEGSLAMHVRDNIASASESEDKQIVVPKYLSESTDNWCTSASGVKGELRRFIDSYLLLRNEAERGRDPSVTEEEGYILGLKNIMDGEKRDLLLTTVSDFGDGQTEEEKRALIEQFLSSDVIHYTVSHYFNNIALKDLSIVIPLSARTDLYNDTIDRIVKKDELVGLFMGINDLGIVDGTEGTELLKLLITHRRLIKGEILTASVIANLCNNGTFRSVLRLERVSAAPDSKESFYDVGTASYLDECYFGLNPWKNEFPLLVDALEELFADQLNSDTFVFSTAAMGAAIMKSKDNPYLLEACRSSRIISVGYQKEIAAAEALGVI